MKRLGVLATVVLCTLLACKRDDPPSTKTTQQEPLKVVPAEGEASIVMDMALVRKEPKTGDLAGRLPKGTKVKVLAEPPQGDWLHVKFGDDFASDGWLTHQAIGR